MRFALSFVLNRKSIVKNIIRCNRKDFHEGYARITSNQYTLLRSILSYIKGHSLIIPTAALQLTVYRTIGHQ